MFTLIKLIFIILGFIISTQSIAKQKFFKWTDENGTVHYTSEEPQNLQTDEVNVNTKKSKITSQLKEPETSGTSLNEESNQRLDDHRKKKQQAKLQTKNNLKKCKKAKASYAKYIQAVRYRWQNPETGEYEYLQDDQRKELLKQFSKTIKRTCK